jgi:hypothetical protein
MYSTHWARSRARIGAAVGSALLLAGFTAVLGAQAATSEVAVSPLAIVSGTATGEISGLAANSQVMVDGQSQQADQNGVVKLSAAPLDGDGVLTLGFTDTEGKPQQVNVDLTDAITGLPLSPAQIADPIVNTTRDVRVTTGDSGTGGGGGSGGNGSGGSSGSGGANSSGSSTPSGAVSTPAGVSIPASSVTAGQARLVIASVTFSPTTVRSRTKPIRVQLTVKDTRGFLIRDAIVFVRGVPERRVHPVAEVRTNKQGVAVVTLRPTKLLPLRTGGRLTVFTRARKAGEPVNGGVSTRRLVSVRLAKQR